MVSFISPFMPGGLYDPNALDGSISLTVCLVSFNYYHVFITIYISNANSVDPDQTPRSVASDLGLHCLPTYLLWDTRHKVVTIDFLRKKMENIIHCVLTSRGPWDGSYTSAHWYKANERLLCSTIVGGTPFTASVTCKISVDLVLMWGCGCRTICPDKSSQTQNSCVYGYY